MPTVIVTFDLKDADDADEYQELYDRLAQVGLSRLSPKKFLRLPRSTAFGTISNSYGATAQEIRDSLKQIMEEASGCEVDRIAVGVVTDWAVEGYQDPEILHQEVWAKYYERAVAILEQLNQRR